MFPQKWGRLFVRASKVIRHKTRQTQTYLPGTASCAASSRNSPPLASVSSTKRKSKAWGTKGSCHGIHYLSNFALLVDCVRQWWMPFCHSNLPVLSGRLQCCLKSAYRVLLSNASFFPRRKSRTQSGKWIAASQPRKLCIPTWQLLTVGHCWLLLKEHMSEISIMWLRLQRCLLFKRAAFTVDLQEHQTCEDLLKIPSVSTRASPSFDELIMWRV